MYLDGRAFLVTVVKDLTCIKMNNIASRDGCGYHCGLLTHSKRRLKIIGFKESLTFTFDIFHIL